jgi:hypothetical protein
VSHPQPAVLPAEEVEAWQPHAHEEFQEVGKVGRIAIGLLGASTVTHLLSTWSDWNTYSVVHRYLGGMPNVDDADVNRADTISRITSIPNVVISVAVVVVFAIWLWRARVKKPFLTKVWWCSWVGALALDVGDPLVPDVDGPDHRLAPWHRRRRDCFADPHRRLRDRRHTGDATGQVSDDRPSDVELTVRELRHCAQIAGRALRAPE